MTKEEMIKLKKWDIVYNVDFDIFRECVIEKIEWEEFTKANWQNHYWINVKIEWWEMVNNNFIHSEYDTSFKNWFSNKEDAIQEAKKYIEYHNLSIKKSLENINRLVKWI